MPAAQETLLCRYHYDPLDRLIDCLPINQANLQRFYCKSRLACEIQGTTQTSIFQHDEQLLAEQQRLGRTLDTHLLATNVQRSVLQSLSLGQRQSSAYAPYGHRTTENGVLSLLGFNGESADAVTGHFLLGNGYRAFNPVLMRFNSPDSLSPFGEGGLNSYAYCLGDPVNQVDPNGHSPLTPLQSLAKMLKRLQSQPRPIMPGLGPGEAAATLKTAQYRAANREAVGIHRAKLKQNVETIEINEAKLTGSKPYYTVGTIENIANKKDSAKAYSLAKKPDAYDFVGQIPSPEVKKTIVIYGKELLNTTHFDVTINYFKHNTSKIRSDTYRRAIIARAEYIRRFAGVDLLKPPAPGT